MGAAARAAGVLVVVPPAPGVDRGLGALRVAGLSLVRRLVLSGTAAGYAHVLVEAGAGAHDAPPPSRAMAPAATRQRLVIVPANVIPQRRWLRAVLERPLEPERLYVDASGAAVVETERVDAALALARAGEGPARLRALFDEAALPPDAAGVLALASAADAPRAERWLLRSLIKQNEGFMSRHFERRLSLAVTRRLVNTPVTPNMMTVVSVLIGLAGAPCFLSAAPGWQLTGALLFLTHSILDGCDGELARLKFLESRWGAVLDFWGDNVVHVAVFSAIALGWTARSGSAWPLVLGAVAVAATLGSAALMFERTAADRIPGGAWAARLVGALSNRDFIYVVIALAAFGQVQWFLVAVAIGTPAFLLLALTFTRNHGGVS